MPWAIAASASGAVSCWTRATPTPRPDRARRCGGRGRSPPNLPPVDFQLSDEQRLLRDTVREFARAEIAPVAEELDRTKSFPYELVARMGELGLMGIPFEEEYGGGGADTLAYTLCVEELARVDSSVCITLAAHTSLGTMPIHLWGSDEQKSEWLPALCRGERLAAFGLTEPEAGSDAGATRTRARLDGDEWVIDGAKQFITNSGTEISGCVTITAVTGGGRRLNSGAARLRLEAAGDLEHHRPQRHAGLRAGRAVPQDGLERVRHPAASVQRVQGSGTEPARAPRRGLQELPPHPRRRPDRRGRDGRRPRPGRARRGGLLRQGAARVRPADLEVPGDPGEDRRHLGADRGGPPAHLPGRDREGPRASRSPSRRRRRS